MAGVHALNKALKLELLALTLLASLAAASLMWSAGEFAWSWDALNHHIYLGLTAEHPRWDLDVMPASYQTYQYPYLYWPVYRLSLLDVSGQSAGALWSAFQTAMILPPVWSISRHVLPEQGRVLPGWLERSAACLLALMGLVLISSLQTTANDLLSAVPLLWALAMWVDPRRDTARAVLAAALLGTAAAFKLSNALYFPVLLVWCWVPGSSPVRALVRLVAMGAGLAGAFALVYAPWGWQLWKLTGNPFYPFLADSFGRG
jgi:hypothetical protein